MGYTLSRAYSGQGHANEAAQTLIKFGFEHLSLVRIEAVVLPDHLASARVLQKAGMQFEGVLHSCQIWRRPPRHLQLCAVTNTPKVLES